jgi:predicted N-acyltransferase
VPTWSAHHIADPRLRDAVAAYLDAERPAVLREIESLAEMTPFRKRNADA